MKLTPFKTYGKSHSVAFTLVELMVAMSIGLILGGTVVLLLVKAVTEERNGLSDTTVEERAYTLQANITSCLRESSSGQGAAFDYSTQVLSTNNQTVGYTTINLFKPNADGSSFTRAQISANLGAGTVVYTPNILMPTNQVVWMANGPGVVLRKLYFMTYFNLDGSLNNQLVYVTFQLDDNGYSQQIAPNNITSINRSFSVQMRCD